IKVVGLSGPMQLHTASGDITAEHINGVVDLLTTSGDVDLSGAISDNSVVKTTSGGITYKGSLDPKGTYHFASLSGDVEITLPESTAFKYDLSSISGDINNKFGGHAGSAGSDPSALLTVTTT